MHYPEFSGEILRLEMLFQFPLEQVAETTILQERLSSFRIDNFGTVAKNFLSFQVPLKIFLFFCDFSSLYNLFFLFGPNSPEK